MGAPKKRVLMARKNGRFYMFVLVPRSIANVFVCHATRQYTQRDATDLSTPSNSGTDGTSASATTTTPADVCNLWGPYRQHFASDGNVATDAAVVALRLNSHGELQHCPELDSSIFGSFEQVIADCGPFESTEQYAAVFGGVLLDKFYLLVASRVEVGLELPFGAPVFQVLETKWVPVQLPNVPNVFVNDRDQRRLKDFSAHGHSNGLYFSDEADLSLPFPFLPPSVRSLHQRTDEQQKQQQQPDLHCDWSHFLRKPFEAVNLEGACSVLFRGFIGEHRLGLQDGQIIRMQLIGRQNHLNPGPRYYGRGLNSHNAAGNDHVYEMILWRYSDEDEGVGLSGASAPLNDGSTLSPPMSPGHARPREHASSMTASHRRAASAYRKRIHYVRHTIFRGTIPIHWTTEIPAGIGEAAVRFDPDPNVVLAGSTSYFRELIGIMDAYIANDVAKVRPEDKLPMTDFLRSSVRCINMLRQSSNPPEEALSRRYVDAVRKAASELDCDPDPMGSVTENNKIELAHVDWLNLVKEFSVDVAVSTLWQNIVPHLLAEPAAAASHGAASVPPSMGVSPSSLSPVATALAPPQSPRTMTPTHSDSSSQAFSLSRSPLISSGSLSASGELQVFSVQQNFVRVNCADSLDRTNLGCFFTCLQASLEMLAMLGVSSADFVDSTPIDSLAGDGSDSDAGADAAAPSGDAMSLAIDDMSATWADGAPTTGLSPPLSPTTSGKRKNSTVNHSGSSRTTNRFRTPFLRSWSDVRDPRRCPPAVARALSEIFVLNGDIVAMMYTNSAALHTNLLRKVAGLKLARSNAVISAQRRYENVFEDRKKFRHFEILLGRNIELHLPSLCPIFMLRPMPYESWGSALKLSGVPRGTTRKDIEKAIRAFWDAEILPTLRQNSKDEVIAEPVAAPPPPGLPAPRFGSSGRPVCFDSSALCMTVFVDSGVSVTEALDPDAFVANNSSVVLAQIDSQAGDDDFCDVVECDNVAVVEFDEDTCRVVDVVRLLVTHSQTAPLVLRHPNVAVLQLAAYSFPISVPSTSTAKHIATSASDAVKKAADSLKLGFKNLVRRL